MPRFYFHLHECGTELADQEGQSLPDASAVGDIARREAREIMAAEIQAGKLCLSCRIEVTDEDQRPVLVLPFKDAIELTGL